VAATLSAGAPPPAPPAAAPALDSGLACLLVVARYLGVAAAPAALARDRDGREPWSEGELLRAARALGLRARRLRPGRRRLPLLPLPALARLNDGRFVILARVDDGQVHLHEPAGGRAVLPRAEFERRWSGSVLRLAAPAAPGGAASPLGWVLPAVLRHRAALAEVLAASLALQLLAMLAPLGTQIVVDKVLVHRGLSTLQVVGAGLLLLAVFEAALGALRGYLVAHTGSRIDAELGARLVRHLLALPLAWFEARRTGETAARVRELDTVRQFLTGPTLTLLLDVPLAAVVMGLLWLYSGTLVLLVLAALPAFALLSAAITPWLRARLEDRFRRAAASQALLVETVTGIETIKALAAEPRVQRRWESALAAHARAAFRAANLAQASGQAATWLGRTLTVLLLWAGAHEVMAGRLTVGELIAFNMLAGRVTGPVLRLVQLWQEVQQFRLALARLRDVLEAPAEGGTAGAREALRLRGEVVLEDVHFRYRAGGPPVLRGLSFRVPAGAMVGIVGRSGSGKSTIARLLQRLYVPEQGRVLLDGLDVGTLDLPALRRQVAVVLQDSLLFAGTVRENIAFGDPGLPLAAVVRAARLAGAHDFVAALPEGYDTVVGERGATLSGGQRQRLAIARALVGDPRVLVLDEATSALDGEAEARLQASLAEIRAGRTVLIIAHRLSTVRAADHLLVVEDGRVVEEGRHEELLRRGGAYLRLWRHQAGGTGPG
jgi:subfamily B ATP-binding cassette protein HlyB/CyaB